MKLNGNVLNSLIRDKLVKEFGKDKVDAYLSSFEDENDGTVLAFAPFGIRAKGGVIEVFPGEEKIRIRSFRHALQALSHLYNSFIRKHVDNYLKEVENA